MIPLLIRLAHDPVIAEYIEDIDFWNVAHKPPSVEQMSDYALNTAQWADELQPLIVQMAEKYKPNVSLEAWISELVAELHPMQAGCSRSITLLLLLGNLRSMTPTEYWTYSLEHEAVHVADLSSVRFRLMDALITRANESSKSGRPLDNLALVRPCFQARYHDSMSLQTLSPFMSLPTVKAMSLPGCKGVDDGYTGRPFQWHYPQFASNIERLELAYCCMDGPGIGEVVKHMPRLRVLRYSHETKWHGCLGDWDAGEFFAYIGKCCSGSLSELSVNGPEVVLDYDGAAPFLKHLAGVKYLELDTQALQPHRGITERRRKDMPSLSAAIPLTTQDSTYTLTDILPSSLESFRIVSSARSEKRIFLHDLSARSTTSRPEEFLSLKRLQICREREMPYGLGYHEAYEIAEWAALSELIPSAVTYSYSLAEDVEPAWHQQFLEKYPKIRDGDHTWR